MLDSIHYEIARKFLDAKGKAVILTGAGISTACGIPDFRSATGLWATTDPQKAASRTALQTNPKLFWQFYKERFAGLEGVVPCRGHEIIAELEKRGLVKGIITQNVDELHQTAGNVNVAEMHGRLHALRCADCDEPAQWESLTWKDDVPVCVVCGGVIRPGVVLFGEMLPGIAIDDAYEWAHDAEVLLAVGTSLRVRPVADYPKLLIENKDREEKGSVYVINDSPTPYENKAPRLGGDLNVQLENILAAVDELSTS